MDKLFRLVVLVAGIKKRHSAALAVLQSRDDNAHVCCARQILILMIVALRTGVAFQSVSASYCGLLKLQNVQIGFLGAQ